MHVPSARSIVKHVVPSLLEGVLGPAVVFYLALVVAGFDGALYSALGFSIAALARRLATRQRVPATLLLGVLILAGRTVVAVITGSALLYFMQPTLGTFLVGLAFLVSAGARRPFIQRLAHDFCPFSQEMLARWRMRRFFTHISLLWAAVMLANAGTVLGLLLTSSLRSFVLERTAVSWSLSAVAVVASVYLFRRVLRHEGIRVRFGVPPAPATAA
jgi:intracellular septation protein A